jgi:protein SCO1/2
MNRAMPDAAPVGGAFSLTDHFGRRVTEADYTGRFLLVFFGFTHCKVVCPRALGRISGALGRLGPAAESIQPLYVSVDPERDAPEVLRAYLAERHPRFIGLTGSREEIDAIKTAYRVFARRADDAAADYTLSHSALTYLMDPQGRYLRHFSPTLEEDTLAQGLRTALAAPSPRTDLKE